MNGYSWGVTFVDANSAYLIDRSGRKTVATTDFHRQMIYLSRELRGDFLRTVLLHELGHCTMFSYHILDDIHSFVYPSKRIEAEEWVCNFIADYGDEVFRLAEDILTPDRMYPRYSA